MPSHGVEPASVVPEVRARIEDLEAIVTVDGCRPPGLVACLQCANWDSVGTRRAAVPHKYLILLYGRTRKLAT
jgi:hypothetical protein